MSPALDTLLGIGDCNGDGIPDILYLNASGTSVLLGMGQLRFEHGSGWTSGPVVPAASAQADFNNDGQRGFALGTEGGIQVFQNLGNGTYPSGSI